MNRVSVQKIEYSGWSNCLQMDNGLVRLIVTMDVGPRIILFALQSAENIFYVHNPDKGLKGGDEWRLYGGHRLWHSPQVGFRPNQPDNDPVEYIQKDDALILTGKTETATGIQKSMRIEMATDAPKVRITHELYNLNLWPVQLSVWALSALRGGGVGVLPVPQRDTFYLPNYMLSFWPFTAPNDSRFIIGEKYFRFIHDPSNSKWFKIGLQNPEGWGAYVVDDSLFIKKAAFYESETYPDYGANSEIFGDEKMFELETLSPLRTLEPGTSIYHEEEWYLYGNAAAPASDADISNNILPIVEVSV